MGINERKEKGKEIRRTDIIEAAERIFFSKGYDNATMDDVAKEAEFSKRTVYVYFNSKEQIYFEIMIKGYKLLIGMLKEDRQKENVPNAVEEIKQLSMALQRFNQLYPEYFRAIMEYENGELDFDKGIPDHSRQECYGLGEEVLGYLIRALKRGISEKTVRGDMDVVKMALSLWACVIGVFNTAGRKHNYIKHYHHMTSEELIASAFQLMISSIQNPDGGKNQ